jgi:rubredoxin
VPPTTVVRVGDPQYRCDSCGNVTRFDVTASRTTKAFHHYTVGGELNVEEVTVLSHHVDDVVCRWCGNGKNVIQIGEGERSSEEPGTQSRTP